MSISQKAVELSSSFHVARSQKIGAEGEKLFRKLFESRDSTEGENIDHVDYFTELGPTDVKGNKPCHKKGYILVELLNVQGRPGWASKESKAENIAFCFDEGIYLVKKDELRLLVIDLCPSFVGEDSVLRKNSVKPEDGAYNWIGRVGRKDVFTYIKKDDLTKMTFLFVPDK